MSMLDPIHPGEILEEEFMKPLELSANALAHSLDVPVTRVSEIVRGRRGITADTALRMARLFGTTPEFWLGLQSDFDLRVARRDSGRAISDAVSPLRTDRVLGQLEVRETEARYGPASARGLDRRRRRKAR
jgi:addiction module HigA family antidote